MLLTRRDEIDLYQMLMPLEVIRFSEKIRLKIELRNMGYIDLNIIPETESIENGEASR